MAQHAPVYKPSLDPIPVPDDLATAFDNPGKEVVSGNTRAVCYKVVPHDQPIQNDGEIHDRAPSEMLKSLALLNHTDRTGFLDWARGSHVASNGLRMLNDTCLDDALFCTFHHENQVIVSGRSTRLNPEIVATVYQAVRETAGHEGVTLTGELKMISINEVKSRKLRASAWRDKLIVDPTIGGTVEIPEAGKRRVWMQVWKAATPDGDLGTAIDWIRSGELAKRKIFLHAYDVTRDARGIWRKITFITNKLMQVDWRMSKDGRWHGTFTETHRGNTTNVKIIIENDDKVGRNCVSFMYTVSLAVPGREKRVSFRVRGKFYIKPIFLLECGSQSGDIGTNLAALLMDNNNRVGGSKEDTVGDGYTRCELTFYMDRFKPQFAHMLIPEQEELVGAVSHCAGFMSDDCVLRAPHALLMRNYLNARFSNVILADAFYNVAINTHSVNELTRRVAGNMMGRIGDDETTAGWKRNYKFTLRNNLLANKPVVIYEIHRSGPSAFSRQRRQKPAPKAHSADEVMKSQRSRYFPEAESSNSVPTSQVHESVEEPEEQEATDEFQRNEDAEEDNDQNAKKATDPDTGESRKRTRLNTLEEPPLDYSPVLYQVPEGHILITAKLFHRVPTDQPDVQTAASKILPTYFHRVGQNQQYMVHSAQLLAEDYQLRLASYNAATASHPAPPIGPTPYPSPLETMDQLCSRIQRNTLKAQKKQQEQADRESKLELVPTEAQRVWPAGMVPPTTSDLASEKAGRKQTTKKRDRGQKTIHDSFGVESPEEPLADEEDAAEEEEAVERAVEETRKEEEARVQQEDESVARLTSEDIFGDAADFGICELRASLERKGHVAFVYTADKYDTKGLSETITACRAKWAQSSGAGVGVPRFIAVFLASNDDELNNPICYMIDMFTSAVSKLQASKQRNEGGGRSPVAKMAETMTRLLKSCEMEVLQVNVRKSAPAVHQMHRRCSSYSFLQQIYLTLLRIVVVSTAHDVKRQQEKDVEEKIFEMTVGELSKAEFDLDGLREALGSMGHAVFALTPGDHDTSDLVAALTTGGHELAAALLVSDQGVDCFVIDTSCRTAFKLQTPVQQEKRGTRSPAAILLRDTTSALKKHFKVKSAPVKSTLVVLKVHPEFASYNIFHHLYLAITRMATVAQRRADTAAVGGATAAEEIEEVQATEYIDSLNDDASPATGRAAPEDDEAGAEASAPEAAQAEPEAAQQGASELSSETAQALASLGLMVVESSNQLVAHTKRQYTAFYAADDSGFEAVLLAGFSVGVHFFTTRGVATAHGSVTNALVKARTMMHDGALGTPEPLPLHPEFDVKHVTSWPNCALEGGDLVETVRSFMLRALPSVSDIPVGLVDGPLTSHQLPVPVGEPTLQDIKTLQVAYAGLHHPDLVNVQIWTDQDPTRKPHETPRSEPPTSTVVAASMPPPPINVKIQRNSVIVNHKKTKERKNYLGPMETRYFADMEYDRHIRDSIDFYTGDALRADRVANIARLCNAARGTLVYGAMCEARDNKKAKGVPDAKEWAAEETERTYEIIAVERQQGKASPVWLALLRDANGNDRCHSMRANVNRALNHCDVVLLDAYHHQTGNRHLFFHHSNAPIGTLVVRKETMWIMGNRMPVCELSIVAPSGGVVQLSMPSRAEMQTDAAGAEVAPEAETPEATAEAAPIAIHEQCWENDELFTINSAVEKDSKWVLGLTRRVTNTVHKCFAGGARGYCQHALPFDVCGVCNSWEARQAHHKGRVRLPAPLSAELLAEPCVLRLVKTNTKDAYCVVLKEAGWQYHQHVRDIATLGKPATGVITVESFARVTGCEFQVVKSSEPKTADITLLRTTTGDVFQTNRKRSDLDLVPGCKVNTATHKIVE